MKAIVHTPLLDFDVDIDLHRDPYGWHGSFTGPLDFDFSNLTPLGRITMKNGLIIPMYAMTLDRDTGKVEFHSPM
jgi:hypothetical protein